MLVFKAGWQSLAAFPISVFFSIQSAASSIYRGGGGYETGSNGEGVVSWSIAHLPERDGGLLYPEVEVFLEGGDPFQLLYGGIPRMAWNFYAMNHTKEIYWIGK